MEVVILVAGRGTRFNEYLPKCLVKFGEETLIERTIQLIRDISSEVPIRVITGYKSELISKKVNDMGYHGIVCIHNDEFEADQNIISARIGLEISKSDTLVLEGDCVFNSETMEQFISQLGRGKSVIFANKVARKGAKNAIVCSGNDSSIRGYMIGERPESMRGYEWYDMAGAAIFSGQRFRCLSIG